MREQAVPVYAALVASVARGIKEQSSPKSTSLKRGPLKFSLSWAKDWMKQNNIRVRHATSDRTVTPNEVVEASKTFFSQLESYKNRCEKGLVFNTDEFFVCLGLGQANATWTWERIDPGESRTISVRREKQGFTCNVLSSAAGEIKMLQFIFQGTSRVFVNVGSDPRVLQCAPKGSHFQDASTWATFLSRFKERLASEREAMKKPVAPALLIIDEATQHSGTDEILIGSSCDVVRIPKKMTHVFQPADQFVISGLKQRAIQLYNDDVSRIFARSDLNSAISNVICTSRTLFREKKVSYIVQAMQELPQAQIMASWEITEIPVVLFGSKKKPTVTSRCLQAFANSFTYVYVVVRFSWMMKVPTKLIPHPWGTQKGTSI